MLIIPFYQSTLYMMFSWILLFHLKYILFYKFKNGSNISVICNVESWFGDSLMNSKILISHPPFKLWEWNSRGQTIAAGLFQILLHQKKNCKRLYIINTDICLIKLIKKI